MVSLLDFLKCIFTDIVVFLNNYKHKMKYPEVPKMKVWGDFLIATIFGCLIALFYTFSTEKFLNFGHSESLYHITLVGGGLGLPF